MAVAGLQHPGRSSSVGKGIGAVQALDTNNSFDIRNDLYSSLAVLGVGTVVKHRSGI